MRLTTTPRSRHGFLILLAWLMLARPLIGLAVPAAGDARNVLNSRTSHQKLTKSLARQGNSGNDAAHQEPLDQDAPGGAKGSGMVAHMVRILLRPEYGLALRPAFAALRSHHPDLQTIYLDSTAAISSLLELPLGPNGVSTALGDLRLRPFMPEHSIVFEDMREHLNPTLFRTTGPLSVRPEQEILRSSEDRIARWFTLSYQGDVDPHNAAAMARRSPAVLEAEPLYTRQPLSGVGFRPNDPLIDTQYALRLMHAFEAWSIVRCDTLRPNHDLDTMILADIDVGVWMSHPDLVQAIWHDTGEEGYDTNGDDKISNNIDDDQDGYVDDFEGWDYVGFGYGTPDKSPWSTSCPPHGTHTTGIMAASGNNGKGIAGVAFGAKVIVIKAATDQGDGLQPPSIQAGPEGIVYSTDHGAKVINCSYGSTDHSQVEQDVINYAYGKGSIVVASAGNNGQYEDLFPAACEHAFSVTSVDAARSFNNTMPDYNRHVAVSAPGQDIMSTFYTSCGDPSGYDLLSGTSMAAPQVTGALGLVWQHYPWYTNRQVMERLRVTSDTLGSLDPYPGLYGHGLVNILRAVTDSPAYSLRLDRVDGPANILALNNGATGTFILTFSNYLNPLVHASVTPEVFDSLDAKGVPVRSVTHHVTCLTKRIDIGAIGTLSSTSGLKLDLHADSTVPPQSKIIVRLWVSDSSLGYVGDYDSYEFRVDPGVATLDTNGIIASFDDKGCIGYRDQTMDQQGDGFVWSKAPATISETHRALLLGGGMIIAADTGHVVDGLGVYDSYATKKYDLTPSAPLVKSSGTPFGSGQTITLQYSDTLADTSTRVGVSVLEHAYALTAPEASNSVICDYVFTGPTRGHSFNASLFIDWDIGTYGTYDSARFDVRDSIFYIWRNTPGYPVVAMKITSHIDATALTYYAMLNDNDDGGYHLPFPSQRVGLAPSFPKDLKWKLLYNNKTAAGSGDVAIVLGERGLDTRFGPQRMTYVISCGADRAAARLAVLNTQAIMEGRKSVPRVDESLSGAVSEMRLWPDPARSTLNIQAPEGYGPFAIRLLDALGRTVWSGSGLTTGATVPVAELPSGVYSVELTTSSGRVARRFVKE